MPPWPDRLENPLGDRRARTLHAVGCHSVISTVETSWDAPREWTSVGRSAPPLAQFFALVGADLLAAEPVHVAAQGIPAAG
jgi:hypothetical protein